MKRNFGTVSDYMTHFEACDQLFPTNLSERVNLKAYSMKLHDRATSFEIWQDNYIVGLLSAYINTDIVFISHICVLPEAPTGSGHQLFEALLIESALAGKDRIRLHVEPSNKKAITFYTRHGFAEIDETDGVLLMERMVLQKQLSRKESDSMNEA